MSRPTLEYVPKAWSSYHEVWAGPDLQSRSESSGVFGSGDYGCNPSTRYYTGTVTPNYFVLKKQGKLPLNSYTVHYHKVWDGSFYQRDYEPWSGFTYVNGGTSTAALYTFTPFQLGLDNGLTDAKNRALLKAQSRLSAVRFNAAQFLGERKQTAELLASTAVRITNAARSLKRADLRGFMQSLSLGGTETRSLKRVWRRVEGTSPDKRIANHWLEFVYGWKPLLSDAHDAARLLAERIVDADRSSGTVVGKGSAKRKYGDMESMGYPYHLKFANYTTRAKYVLHYRMTSEARSLLAQTGISNPALLAWELLPYSFVVDWFLPVGNYLGSLTGFDGFELIQAKSCLNTLEEGEMYMDHAFYRATNWTISSWSGLAYRKEFVYSRAPVGSWPEYCLEVKSPIGGEPLSRLLTATSLLRVLFK